MRYAFVVEEAWENFFVEFSLEFHWLSDRRFTEGMLTSLFCCQAIFGLFLGAVFDELDAGVRYLWPYWIVERYLGPTNSLHCLLFAPLVHWVSPGNQLIAYQPCSPDISRWRVHPRISSSSEYLRCYIVECPDLQTLFRLDFLFSFFAKPKSFYC